MSDTNLNIHAMLDALGHERRIHYALDSFKGALVDAGSPEKNVQSIVIAGTNGKGTVTLFTTAALAKAGKRVATYMSPHLVSVTERFLLNGDPISETHLSKIGNRYFALASKHKLSYFEFLTILFFVWAKEVKADVLVLEVGLGGRLDATNVTQPMACAVTSIDFDHMPILGNTLKQILMEKISVVPRGGTLVSGITQAELSEEAGRWCRSHDVRYVSSRGVLCPTGNRDWYGQELLLGNRRFRISNPNPRWIDNTATAYLLLKAAYPELSDDVICDAFESTVFPGRLECVSREPMVLLSGDHNPAGLSSLIETIEGLPPKKIHTLCAFSLDKPYAEMFRTLERVSETITLTTFPKQGDLPDDYRRLSLHFKRDPLAALQEIRKVLSPDDVLIITGSLYLVGTVRASINH